jgi:quercetin dioxygenase-like cupin family protein
MKLNKAHEDSRRAVYIVDGLLPDNQEFSFIKLNKGKAIGACSHTKEEYWVVIKGEVEVWTGNKKIIAKTGDSGIFPANTSHACVGIQESIFSEWGIVTAEKMVDAKDIEMKKELDKIND